MLTEEGTFFNQLQKKQFGLPLSIGNTNIDALGRSADRRFCQGVSISQQLVNATSGVSFRHLQIESVS
jgi:hypothetical protein